MSTNLFTIRDEIAYSRFEDQENRTKFSNVYNAFTNHGRVLDKEGKFHKFEMKDLVTLRPSYN
jgi:hypothetical protein